MKRFLMIFLMVLLTLGILKGSGNCSVCVVEAKAETSRENEGDSGNAVDRIMETGENAFQDVNSGLWEKVYEFHKILKDFTPLIFVGSIVLGFLVIVFSRKDKGLRQHALMSFCIGIPVLTLMFVYGIPYVQAIGTLAMNTFTKQDAQIHVVEDTTSSEKTMRIYDDVQKRTQNADSVVQKEKDAYQIWEGYEHLNRMLKGHMVPIILGCEVFGIIVIALASKNKRMRRWAGVSLCGVLPALLLVVVYLIPVIQEIFM